MGQPSRLQEDAVVVVQTSWQNSGGLKSNSTGPQRHLSESGGTPGQHGSWKWIVILATCIACINKRILVDLHFTYPITVAWMGLFTTTLCSWVAVRTQVPRSARRPLTSRQYLTQVLPTGFCMAITFHLGNTAYLYLPVSFIQMLKAACPVITMLLLFLLRLERATTRLVLSVLIISGGVALASWGQVNLNLVGLAVMLTSVVAESARLVLTQHLLVAGSQGMHPMEGLLYIGSACTMCLMAQAAFWEWGKLLESGQLATVTHTPISFAIASVAGFGVNALAVMVIKLTSSLTLKVLSTVKDAALVTVGVVIFHEKTSTLQLAGYLISLVGFAWYNSLQLRASRMAAAGAAKGKPWPSGNTVNSGSSSSGGAGGYFNSLLLNAKAGGGGGSYSSLLSGNVVTNGIGGGGLGGDETGGGYGRGSGGEQWGGGSKLPVHHVVNQKSA